MCHGPKEDVVEIDDEDDMSEAELYVHIHSHLEFCRQVFGHLASSYRKLCQLEKKRREAYHCNCIASAYNKI